MVSPLRFGAAGSDAAIHKLGSAIFSALRTAEVKQRIKSTTDAAAKTLGFEELKQASEYNEETSTRCVIAPIACVNTGVARYMLTLYLTAITPLLRTITLAVLGRWASQYGVYGKVTDDQVHRLSNTVESIILRLLSERSVAELVPALRAAIGKSMRSVPAASLTLPCNSSTLLLAIASGPYSP